MKTKKTREELELRADNKVLGIWAIILVITTFIFLMLYCASYSKNYELENQLSECQDKSSLCDGLIMYDSKWISSQECQEQVPACDFEEGYWGFKVVCSDDFFGWKNKNKVIDQHFHNDLESCEQGLKFYISDESCEVVQDKEVPNLKQPLQECQQQVPIPIPIYITCIDNFEKEYKFVFKKNANWWGSLNAQVNGMDEMWEHVNSSRRIENCEVLK